MKKINIDKLKENITQRINSDIAACNIGGASVRVCQSGVCIYEDTFGIAKKDSIYRMASMTKPITALAVLIQISRGLVSLDDTVDEFFPEFDGMQVEFSDGRREKCIKQPRVFNMLTHTSGIGSGEVSGRYMAKMTGKDKKDLTSAINYYSKMPLDFQSGTSEFYSSIAAFDILAGIVEKTSALPFDKFVRDEITDKLGMVDTTFTPTAAQWDRMIPMHNKVNGENVLDCMPVCCIFSYFPTTYFCGGAGLASTLSDYSKFAEMLLSNDGSIVPQYLIKAMSTPQLTPNVMRPPVVWGLGVRVITDDSYTHLPAHSFGWSGAYGTHFWVDPDNEISAVYLKNSYYDGGAGALTALQFEDAVTSSLER